ncbi:hypothetical protein [uncultured Shewanella sp.]|uniref:ATP-grasp domain-containing protein n=1 Tax=uncultured Shewanella sp. TaxID=173975 RepID=UPI0026382D49|nr:hypothetical protein [uncultured Shewanella sp.]
MDNVAVIGNSEVFSQASELWQKEISLLKQGLEAKNVHVKDISWDKDEGINWQEFKAAYIGEVGHPSGYDKFRAWCEKVKLAGVELFNGLATLKLYTDKQKYLTSLASLGIPVIPTHFLDEPIKNRTMLMHIAEQYQLGDVLVVKPTYATFGENNFLVNLIDDEFNSLIAEIQPGIMVQKFLPNVRIEGEYSFIIYNNKVSHAVLKTPSKWDHRTHKMHGGTSLLVTPCEADLKAVQNVLESIVHLTGEKAHKFRIDMIRCEQTQQLLLLELELGDPIQYLHLLDDEQQREAIDHFIDSTQILA